MDNFIPLEAIKIASPCHADWDAMQGDDRARFCRSCEKHVYNLSDMTHAQAQALVNEKEGRMCVQFYRRADGTMLTDECQIPLRPVRNGARWLWRAAGAGIAAVAALYGGFRAGDAEAKPTKTQRDRKAGKPINPPPYRLTGIVAPPKKPIVPKPVAPKKVTIIRPDKKQSAMHQSATRQGVEKSQPKIIQLKGDPAPIAIRGEIAPVTCAIPLPPAPTPTPVPSPTPEPSPTPPTPELGAVEMGVIGPLR